MVGSYQEGRARELGERFAEALRPVFAETTRDELGSFLFSLHGKWPPRSMLKCEVCDLVLAKLVPPAAP
jgi:hypothetical protein